MSDAASKRKVSVSKDNPAPTPPVYTKDMQHILRKRTSSAYSDTRKPKWITRSMAEEFNRNDVLFTTLREAMIYLVFLIAVSFISVGTRSSTMYYFTDALRGQFLEKEFTVGEGSAITFGDIKTASHFWQYTTSLMLTSFYWEHYYSETGNNVKEVEDDDRKVLYENQLMGVPRIRQVRVRNDSCIIHEYFRRLFLTCYDLYSEKDEDTETYGLGTSTAWVYTGDETTKSIPYSGTISKYGGGGFYQDLTRERNASEIIIQGLMDNLWVTRGTRGVFVDFTVYNANLNLFCVCKLIFEFPPTGGVLPSYSFKTVHLLRYVDSYDYLTFGFEMIVYAMAVFYLIEELREMAYFKLRYFLQFWSYMDWLNIGFVAGNFMMSYVIPPKVSDAIDKAKKNPDQYGNFELLADNKDSQNTMAALLMFFSYVKLFKYISFNKTMGQLNNTLKKCALDILGFCVMFFIIFFAFAELGYLLFGSQVEDYNSFGVSMFSLLRTILGDFDYTSIEKANRFLAPMYFLSYIFFVFFVLLNMFLAIINDTYADVKTEIAIAPDEMQMTDFIKNGFFNLLRKCGLNLQKYHSKQKEFFATIQQIRDVLKKCGFNNAEIEQFFTKYKINPLADLNTYDITKTLKDLEGQAAAAKEKSEDTSVVQLADFINQQSRLDQIERHIQTLATRVDVLLERIDNLETARKLRTNQG